MKQPNQIDDGDIDPGMDSDPDNQGIKIEPIDEPDDMPPSHSGNTADNLAADGRSKHALMMDIAADPVRPDIEAPLDFSMQISHEPHSAPGSVQDTSIAAGHTASMNAFNPIRKNSQIPSLSDSNCDPKTQD